MKAHELVEWMERRGLSNRRTAELLGLSRNTINRYVKGDQPIPRVVELATKGLEPANVYIHPR